MEGLCWTELFWVSNLLNLSSTFVLGPHCLHSCVPVPTPTDLSILGIWWEYPLSLKGVGLSLSPNLSAL